MKRHYLEISEKEMDKLASYTLIFENFSARFQSVVQRGKGLEPSLYYGMKSNRELYLFLKSIPLCFFFSLSLTHYLNLQLFLTRATA